MTAWILPEMSSVIWGAVMYGNGDCYGKMFGLSRQGTGQIGLWGGCQDWSAALYATNGAWSFVAIVYENGTIRIFKNGAWGSVTGSALATTASKLWIGGETVNNGASFRSTFRGTIDDVRLYDRALSVGEVESLYAVEAVRPPPVLHLAKAITVDCTELVVGSNYQLQVSTDLTNWSNWGNPFTATGKSYTNNVFERVSDWATRHFRLISQ
jgi:hypothetical protein